jgi:glycosyltransferase involved in cell wall biosynthesis
MRVAYVCADPGIRYGGTKGASVHMTEMIAALAAEGAEVLALVSDVAAEAPQPPPGAAVELLPTHPGWVATGMRLAGEPHRQEWITDRLDAFGAELMYERLALHSAAGARAAKRLGVPHLVELNAPLVEEARRYRTLDELSAAEWLERVTLESADVVLAVSPPLVAYARGRAAERVELFPNAVALDDRPAAGHRAGRAPVAIFAGRVRPWHGIGTVAAAWKLLGDDAPRLVVVGDPGEARPLLDAAGAELVGPIPHAQVPLVLAGADIGLAPYAADAPDYFSPLKLFDYMAAGLSVIVGDLPAVRTLATDETAVVVPNGDPEALATAVFALSTDVGRRQRLGRAARKLVAAEHTWRHRARRVLDLARECSTPGREMIGS